MSYLKLSKACERLDVSRDTMLRYIAKGWVAAEKLPSGHWRVSEASLKTVFNADHRVSRILESV